LDGIEATPGVMGIGAYQRPDAALTWRVWNEAKHKWDVTSFKDKLKNSQHYNAGFGHSSVISCIID